MMTGEIDVAEGAPHRGTRGCLALIGVVAAFLALLLGLSAVGVPVQPPGAPVMMLGGTQDRINFGLVSVFRVSGTGDAPVAALGVSAFGGSRSAELERWESIVVPWWGQLTAVSLEPGAARIGDADLHATVVDGSRAGAGRRGMGASSDAVTANGCGGPRP